MSAPLICVLRAAGVNCNDETAFAFERAGAEPRQLHVNRLLEKPSLLDDFAGLAVPGGFSYGDDVAAGRILALEIGHSLRDGIDRLLQRGGIVLGICNGFQVLVNSGLLPAQVGGREVRVSLSGNLSNRYEDRWVDLAVNPGRSVFFTDDEPMQLPVAHAEGRFTVDGPDDLAALEEGQHVVLRYGATNSDPEYPANPNGSDGHVAGLCDATGQVLGLMPHPERFLFPWQHPTWTRGPAREVGDGTRIFDNAVAHLRAS